MTFSVSREVLDLGLKIVAITIDDIDIKTQTKKFLNFQKTAYTALKKKYKNFDIETDLILRGFNNIHKKIGVKRRKHTPINELLLKMFLKNLPMAFLFAMAIIKTSKDEPPITAVFTGSFCTLSFIAFTTELGLKFVLLLLFVVIGDISISILLQHPGVFIRQTFHNSFSIIGDSLVLMFRKSFKILIFFIACINKVAFFRFINHKFFKSFHNFFNS